MKLLNKTEKGYSLPEIIFYVAILAVIAFIIVGMLVRIAHSRDRLVTAQKLSTSASVAMDRMLRELRWASDMSTSTSAFDAHPGRLVLSGVDEDGNARTVEFYIGTSTLRIRENTVDIGPLTEEGVSVTNLIFSRSASSTDVAIRIQMTLESERGDSLRTENFYSTAILRQSI